MTRSTPKLDDRLARLGAGLRRAVWKRGLGLVCLCVVAWLTFAFLADWGLRVPRAIRAFHGLVALGLTGWCVWKFVLTPLKALPDASGLALLFERAHGESDELFVSAVEFARGEASGDPALVSKVIEEAESRADELSTQAVLTDRRPTHFALGGLLVLGLAGGWSVANMDLASIFVRRMLGSGVPWPQRTTLAIRIPDLGDGATIADEGEVIRVRLARGMDLPVLIEAKGEIPSSVKLHVEGDHNVVLGTHSDGVFRTLLPSLQTDQTFFATGGDDEDEWPRVEVEVLEPPEVLGIALTVTPPAYSGLEGSSFFDVDEIDVLRGSSVSVWVRSTEDATPVVTQLPDGLPLAFTSAEWPGELAEGDASRAIRLDLGVDESIGFKVELTDDEGLTSPDPPMIRLLAVDDREPEVNVLSPATSEIVVTSGGAMPLRVRVEDDFQVTGLRVEVRPLGGDGEADPIFVSELPLTTVEATRSNVRHAALGAQRLELSSFDTEALKVLAGQRYAIQLVATDNRQPLANESRSLARRARVVTSEELLRRLQDRLAQAKIAAVRLDEQQRERRQRVEDLLEALDGSDELATADSLAVTALVSGERRVVVGAIDLARDLAAVTEDVLYSRIDEKAEGLLDRYDAALSAWPNAQFPSAIWRDLAKAHRDKSSTSSGFAQNLLELVDLSLEIGEDLAESAVDALEAAAQTQNVVDGQNALVLASESMTRTSDRIADLLERLAEWDNFQNVLTLTRDIVNRQKGLKERLQNFAKERK